jgi:hypothetical protein
MTNTQIERTGDVDSVGLDRIRLLLPSLAIAIAMGVASAVAQPDVGPINDESGTPPVFAIAPAGEVEGAYFSVTMEPGTEQTLTAALVNAGERAFDARTFVADAYTVVNGGMGVREDGSEPTGVTMWVSYPTETLRIDPHSTVQREVKVAVPENTLPGQYLTGIVLQTAEPIPGSGSTTFNQALRKTVAVFITVPGPVDARFEVGEASILQGESWSTLGVCPTELHEGG